MFYYRSNLVVLVAVFTMLPCKARYLLINIDAAPKGELNERVLQRSANFAGERSLARSMAECTFQDGEIKDIDGGKEKYLSKTNTEQDCATLVKQKIPKATGASWAVSPGWCYAEFGSEIKPYGGYRACLFEGGMKTIAQAVGEVPSLSNLKSALETAKLIKALGQTGPFTVFAPNNAAFMKVQDEIPNTAANLKKLLLRHVVQGEKITHDQFTEIEQEFPTMNAGDKVKIWKRGGKKMVGFKKVVASDDHADMEVANGVIHIISDVLVTKGEFKTIQNGTKDIVAVASSDPNLSELVRKVGACGTTIIDILKKDGPFTLLAPNNAAFKAIEKVSAGLPKDVLCNLLKRHIVKDRKIMEADFKDGPLKTFNGDLKVTKDGVKTKFGEVMAEIVQGMGDKKASNGIIHVIDKVLLEENFTMNNTMDEWNNTIHDNRCIDCGFAREICCHLGNGTQECRDPSDCPSFGSNVCDLPIKPGPCKAHQPRFGFNSTTQQCTRFIYGGCRGNGNRFFTRELCEGNCTTGTIEATRPREFSRS